MHRRLLVVLLLLLLPSLAHATVDWDEGFEYSGGSVQDMYNSMTSANWGTSCGSNSVVIAPTTQALGGSDAPAPHGGSKMLRETFRGHQGVTPGYQSCYIDRALTASTTGTLYSRFWIYIPSSFVLDSTVTKLTLHPAYAGDSYTSIWWDAMWGSPQVGANVQKVWAPPVLNDQTEILYGGFIPIGQWACLETRITYATPGQQNGVVQLWINGTQSINRSNVWMDQTGQQSVFRSIRLYTQDGLGNIYYDDYAVSRDARIGCSGVPPPPDTTAPTTPTLSATAGNASVQLSWTASSDTSGILRYDIRRSTTGTSGPFTALAQVNGSTLSYQDTTVSNGTTYYYQVSATDQASPSNTSTFSSTATATPAAPGGTSATVLSITSTGRFAINGVTTMLKCVSYYDIMNTHTSDLDAMAVDGINCITAHVDDVLRNNVNSAYNADGSIKAAKQTAIEAAIDYADTKGIVVLLNCTYADTDGFNSAAWLTSPSASAAMTAAISACVNAFKANGNVLFSIVNEHNYGSYADTHTEMAALFATARAACATCLMGFSSSDNIGAYPAGGHLFTTQDGSVVNGTNVEAELAMGVNFLLWHDERNAGFATRATARVGNMRSYLDANGHQNIPFFGDEPAREGSGGLGAAASWLAYYQALQTAGIQGIDLHNDASFDMDPTTFIAQVDSVGQAVMDGLSAALGTPTGQTRAAASITDTFDRADGALGANWDDAYTGASSLTIVSNAVEAGSTTLDSIETNNTATLAANAWGSGTIGTWTGSGLSVARIGLRWSASPTVTGVFCTAARNIDGTRTTQIEQYVNGVYSELAHNGTITWASGDILSCEAVGTSVTAYRQAGGAGDPVAVATGTTTISGTGRGAVLLYNGTASQVSFTGVTFGEFAAPAAITTPQILTLATTTAGATFTYSGSLASTDACTDNGCINYPLASTPGGVITYAWKATDTFVCLFAIDPNGARNNVQYVCAPVTPATDTTAPTISNAAPSGVLIAGTTSTTLSWNTSEPSYCKLNTTDVAYASMSLSPTTPNTGVLGTAFTYTATGLANSTTYNYYVACADEVVVGQTGNISATTHITFSVETPASVDTTLPSTVTNLGATVLSTSQITFSWDAATDNVALHTVNPYRLYFCDDSVCTTKSIQATTTNTSITIGGLNPSQIVYATVRAVDSSNNESAANSNIITATTQPIVLVDVIPPSDPVGLTVTGTYSTSATFAWTPGTDDQGPVTTALELCDGSLSCTAFELKKVEQGSTTLVTGLTASTIYRARIIHIDKAGNPSANYSDRVPFTTTASTGGALTSPRLPVPFGTPRTSGTPLSSGTRLPR